MRIRRRCRIFKVFAAAVSFLAPAFCAFAQSNAVLRVNMITLPGRKVLPPFKDELRVGPRPQEILFHFGAGPNPDHTPLRIRCRLDGFEDVWHEGGGEMYFIVRFYNAAGDSIHQVKYIVRGASPGWTGSLESSPFLHRKENLVAPPNAARLMIVLSSAGPPATIGVYVVQGLVISKGAPDSARRESIRACPIGRTNCGPSKTLKDWERDGTRPTMAKVVEAGKDRAEAFAIIDEDPNGHAEWHNEKSAGPEVSAGDQISLEWDEMFSIGVSDFRLMPYHQLLSGAYRFRLSEVGVFGLPIGPEAVVALRISQPYWKTAGFWAGVSSALGILFVVSFRYFNWRQMQRAMEKLQQQHALQQERLRIAQDIHDDLGARITQISIVSGMAGKDLASSEKARAEFDRISTMSRDLVLALYETVWAVNPDNDHVEAVGTYLCQRINELCAQAGVRCRLHVSLLPRDVEVSSRARHNLIMAANEAAHNAIKHAGASLLTVKVSYENDLLTVMISDDGTGFDAQTAPRGYGLANMQRRMHEIRGTCQIRSQAGSGTSVELSFRPSRNIPPGRKR
jgi:signal transduction histidine kinase